MSARKQVQDAIAAYNTYKIAIEDYERQGDGFPTHVNNALAKFKKCLLECTKEERIILKKQLVK